MSYLYFVSAGAIGPIKIGRTKDVEKRVSDMQCGCPIPLVILCVVEDGASWEAQLHKRFEEHNLSGEWFEREPVIAFLDEMADAHDERVVPLGLGVPPAVRRWREFDPYLEEEEVA